MQSRNKPALYGVGDLARAAKVSEDTIRDWERKRIIKADRDSANRRQFNEEQKQIAIRHAAATR